jgi:hypothetical protein
MTLEQLAEMIKSNHAKLQEGEIIAKIMIITGRSFDRALNGYKLLLEKKLLITDSIAFHGMWVYWYEQSETMRALIDRLDLIPGKVTGNVDQAAKTWKKLYPNGKHNHADEVRAQLDLDERMGIGNPESDPEKTLTSVSLDDESGEPVLIQDVDDANNRVSNFERAISETAQANNRLHEYSDKCDCSNCIAEYNRRISRSKKQDEPEIPEITVTLWTREEVISDLKIGDLEIPINIPDL